MRGSNVPVAPPPISANRSEEGKEAVMKRCKFPQRRYGMRIIRSAVLVVAYGVLMVAGPIGAAIAGDAHVQETIKHAKEGIVHEKEAIKHLEEAVKGSGDAHAKEALEHAKEAVKHAEESLAHAEQAEKPMKGK
jgi:hypothetical protein